jgi:DNA-binding response OmpR family regulator
VRRAGRVDVAARIVSVDQTPIGMSSREFDLLELLVRNRGNVMVRGALPRNY